MGKTARYRLFYKKNSIGKTEWIPDIGGLWTKTR